MSWQHVRISQFGGPEVLELVEEPIIPDPGPGEVRIKVLAAGTGFTDTMIRRGRYPDFKGPLPFTPGYEIVGVVEKAGLGVLVPHEGQMVADLWVIGGYSQYAIRPTRFLVPVPMASRRPKRRAFRSPISPRSRCSPAVATYHPAPRSWSSAPQARSARLC
jgi:NADPH:quinone reductase-like Zn-dependent oxidoreductase